MSQARLLSDLLKAIHHLQPDDRASGVRIAQLLGIKSITTAGAADQHKDEITARFQAPSDTRSPAPRSQSYQPRDIGDDSKPPSIESVLTPLQTEKGSEPVWLSQARYVERDDRLKTSQPLPFSPLFLPRWTRAILSSLASVRRKTDRPDIDCLLRQVVSFKPVSRVPILWTSSTAPAIYLLVDRSANMEYFGLDQNVLSRRLVSIFGKDRTQMLTFDGNPWLAEDFFGATPGFLQQATNPDSSVDMPPSSVLLALSDMGAVDGKGSAASVYHDDWIQFALAVEKSGNRLIVLTPYPEQRWPIKPNRRLKIVQWDRHATLSTVLKAIRAASVSK